MAIDKNVILAIEKHDNLLAENHHFVQVWIPIPYFNVLNYIQIELIKRLRHDIDEGYENSFTLRLTVLPQDYVTLADMFNHWNLRQLSQILFLFLMINRKSYRIDGSSKSR